MDSSRRIVRKILAEADEPELEPTDYAPPPDGSEHDDETRGTLPSVADKASWVSKIPRSFYSALERDGVKARAGYSSPADLELLGGGMMGYAFLLPDGRVLKMTSDEREAITSSVLIGRDMPNVVEIFDVFLVRDAAHMHRYFDREMPVYGVITEFVPGDLDEAEAEIVMKVFHAYVNYSKMQYANPDEQINMNVDWARGGPAQERHIDVFEELMLEPSINLQGYDPDLFWSVWEDMKRGLLELGSVGIGYMDIHSGNVRKDDGGNYVLIDLGRSRSVIEPSIPVVESARIPAVD